MYIYALQLQNNKFYIGKTTNISNRISQHLTGAGAQWTKLHKPINVIFVVEVDIDYQLQSDCNCHKLENLFTEAFMLKYGEKNVRGGEYCKINGNYKHIENTLRLYSSLEEMDKYLNPTKNLKEEVFLN